MNETYTYSDADYERDLLELRANEIAAAHGLPVDMVLRSLSGNGTPPTIEDMKEAVDAEREAQNDAAGKWFEENGLTNI